MLPLPIRLNAIGRMQRLARSIVLEDVRLKPPIAQVVFYQSGIGSDENFYSRYVQGVELIMVNFLFIDTRICQGLLAALWVCFPYRFFHFHKCSFRLGDKIEQAYAFIAQ